MHLRSVSYLVLSTVYTDRRLAVDPDCVEVLLSSSTGHVTFEVRDVPHETQTVLRRVLQTQQTFFDFHLRHCNQSTTDFARCCRNFFLRF